MKHVATALRLRDAIYGKYLQTLAVSSGNDDPKLVLSFI